MLIKDHSGSFLRAKNLPFCVVTIYHVIRKPILDLVFLAWSATIFSSTSACMQAWFDYLSK